MRLYTTPKTTAAYYDRNPTSKAFNSKFTNGGPTASTNRSTYTAPTGRKLHVELIWLTHQRLTAAAPVGEWQASIHFTPSGDGLQPIVTLIDESNNVAEKEQIVIGHCTLVLPGDQINQNEIDASTGGTILNASGMKGTEFDA